MSKLHQAKINGTIDLIRGIKVANVNAKTTVENTIRLTLFV
jgi:hypothetical protein